jgi:hypothetical protein
LEFKDLDLNLYILLWRPLDFLQDKCKKIVEAESEKDRYAMSLSSILNVQ